MRRDTEIDEGQADREIHQHSQSHTHTVAVAQTDTVLSAHAYEADSSYCHRAAA